MKLIIERLNKDAKSSFILQKDVYAHYPTPWHHHPEYELVLVLKSSGDKIIGDHMSSFTDGDLAFLGPNLPHVYRNNKSYYEENPDLTAEAIVIHFNLDFLALLAPKKPPVDMRRVRDIEEIFHAMKRVRLKHPLHDEMPPTHLAKMRKQRRLADRFRRPDIRQPNPDESLLLADLVGFHADDLAIAAASRGNARAPPIRTPAPPMIRTA